MMVQLICNSSLLTLYCSPLTTHASFLQVFPCVNPILVETFLIPTRNLHYGSSQDNVKCPLQ